MRAWFTGLDPVSRMGLVVLLLLLASTGIVFLLPKSVPARDDSELRARVKSWWVMAGVFFAVIFAGPPAAHVFFGFLSFWALKEFVTLLKTRPADHRGLVWSFLSIPMQYYFVATGSYGMFIILIPVYMFLLIPMRLVLARETAGFVTSASQIQWGLMAFVFGLSHMAFLLNFSQKTGSGADGRALLIFLVFVAEISDVLQYVWGKLLGGPRIIPSISPNKTWSGFLGGAGSAVAVSLTLRFLTPFSPAETVIVSLLITVAGFFGGAVMSAVKRDFGVKDFGRLIPGHGGILDRVDSLCYAGPIFFHFVRYFHYR